LPGDLDYLGGILGVRLFLHRIQEAVMLSVGMLLKLHRVGRLFMRPHKPPRLLLSVFRIDTKKKEEIKNRRWGGNGKLTTYYSSMEGKAWWKALRLRWSLTTV